MPTHRRLLQWIMTAVPATAITGLTSMVMKIMHIYNMGNFPPIGCRTCHYDTVQEWDETQGNGWDYEVVSPYRKFYNDVANLR